MPSRLEPKLFSVAREGYTAKKFSSDLVAGVVVGIVALPLAIAFAIASGVKPEQGLYTAIILRTRNLLAIDASGEQALEDLLQRTKKDGMILVISGVHKQPLFRLSASGLIDKIGEENVCGDIDGALERARQILGITTKENE